MDGSDQCNESFLDDAILEEGALEDVVLEDMVLALKTSSPLCHNDRSTQTKRSLGHRGPDPRGNSKSGGWSTMDAALRMKERVQASFAFTFFWTKRTVDKEGFPPWIATRRWLSFGGWESWMNVSIPVLSDSESVLGLGYLLDELSGMLASESMLCDSASWFISEETGEEVARPCWGLSWSLHIICDRKDTAGS